MRLHKYSLCSAMIFVAVLLALYAASIAAWGTAGAPSAKRSADTGAYRSMSSDGAEILGCVRSVALQAGDGQGIRVKLSVVFFSPFPGSVPHSVAARSLVTVDSGDRAGFDVLGQFPRVWVGEYVLWNVLFPKEGNELLYEGGPFCPIDVDPLIPIRPGAVSDLITALKVFQREPAPGTGKLIPHEEIIKLWRSKNYFLWSLGVYWLCEDGTKSDLMLLDRAYGTDSLRKVLWVIRESDLILRDNNNPNRPSNGEQLFQLMGWLNQHFTRRANPPVGGAPQFKPNPLPSKKLF